MSSVKSTGSVARRDRKKRDTRGRLLEVALGLFVERGYDATSMDAIADGADVARGTVFNHFGRKEDFLVAWIETRREAARAAVSRAGTGGTAERLRTALQTLCMLHERDVAVSRPLIRCWLQCGGPLLASASDTSLLLRDLVEAGRERGDVRQDVNADAAARALLDVYLGALYRWAARPERVRGKTLTNDLLQVLEPLLRGIATEAPQKEKG